MSDKPVLFLDIDGVINVIPRTRGNPDRAPHLRVWDEWKTVEILGFPITYSPQLIAHLNSLGKRIDIVWLTTWREMAINDFAPVVGLDKFPFIDPKGSEYPWDSQASFRGSPSLRWWKLNGVLEHIDKDGRPFIWIDDDLRSETKKYVRSIASDSGVGNLMFIPFDSKGIEKEHIESIERFVSA